MDLLRLFTCQSDGPTDWQVLAYQRESACNSGRHVFLAYSWFGTSCIQGYTLCSPDPDSYISLLQNLNLKPTEHVF